MFREEIKGFRAFLKEGVIPNDDLRQIARKHNVDTSMFIKFWNARFPQNGDKNYAAEWAKRIMDGSAFAHADSQTAKALQSVGFKQD